MLKNYAKEPIFKGKKQSFRIRKIFYRVKRQRIKREIEQPFFKPIIVFINDMDSFEEKRNEESKTK